MKRYKIVFLILIIISLSCNADWYIPIPTKTIDPIYFTSNPLDAEYLAELGMEKRYKSLIPEMQKYIPQPAEIEEYIDYDKGIYIVQSLGIEYKIQDPEFNDLRFEAWGRATVAFFYIVNNQLQESNYKYYAINGGNELSGIFLTFTEVEAVRGSLPNKRDWPYIPIDDPPWYGQYH
jgi:hypothetical protein